MFIKEFVYEKADGLTTYTVAVIKESMTDTEGLSFKELTEEDIQKVGEIFKEFETKLAPYVKKAWRKFTNAKVRKILRSEKV